MLLPVDDALARIVGAVKPLGSEMVSLGDAAGRTLASDIKANLFNPAFDVSAMDGYAVRAEDIRPGATLTMIGTSQAGAGYAGRVEAGQCARIFTGAPIPAGADAVVMQEQTEAAGNAITFDCDVAPGRNIRFRGEDFAQGSVLATAGSVLTPQRLTLITAGNVSEVSVTALPDIALLATGDELVAPGNPVGPDQIVASNSVGLAALLALHAGRISDYGIVGDRRDRLEAALAEALAGGPDVLITTGGASVGEHDLVREMLEANHVEIDFWRIAMRPGKPLMFGRRGNTLVFGLPGNPVSALVTAKVFVLPTVLALSGATPSPPLYLPLAAPLDANGPRRHFMRGRLVSDDRRGTVADPIRQTDSGHLSSLAQADILIVQRENSAPLDAGELVEVHLL